MIRGTTQDLIFDVGMNTDEVSQLWLTFSHSNKQNAELITKEKGDVSLSGTTVKVTLSQEETLMLNQYNLKDKKNALLSLNYSVKLNPNNQKKRNSIN